MKKILLVDDEADVREAMKEFLENLGYTVLTAATADEGLSLVALESPQVVLSDVIMPDMDGVTFLKAIRKKYPETIVILISGLQNESVAKEAIRYGAYDYITKPFDLDDLNNRILSRLF